ncbi:MAG: glycosyltransferase family 87 protein [Terracidiphilus sp.]
MSLRSGRARLSGLVLIALSGGFSILIGFIVGNNAPGGVIGFQGPYYGTRCLLHRCDPYRESDLIDFYSAEAGQLSSQSLQRRKAITLYVNLPTTFLFIAPFAMLPWGPAHALWMVLISASVLLAAILIWDSSARFAPGVSLFLLCFLLANSEILFATGNTAALVVSFCALAVWCFLEDRFVPAGVLCLAAGLAMKPHDAGLVWLYFLLAGGVQRKRALQALAITAALGIAALLWVSRAAPHWLPEMQSNLAAISAHGGLNEPGPASMTGHSPAKVIDLQSVIGIFSSNPGVYNSLSYLVCGALLLIWSIKTLRSRFTPAGAWIALAAAAPLSMLPAYHRTYDAKLLMLAIPACAMLWAKGDRIGRLALGITAAATVIAADIPLSLLILATERLNPAPVTLPAQLLTAMLTGPVTLVLLALSIFYLCIYIWRSPARIEAVASQDRKGSLASRAPA